MNRKIALFNIYGDEYNKNELINMEAEIDSYLKEIKELDESISVGNSLVSEIENTKKLLESAKAWGCLLYTSNKRFCERHNRSSI